MLYVSIMFEFLLVFLVICILLWVGLALYKWLFQSKRFGSFVTLPKEEVSSEPVTPQETEKGPNV